MNIFMFEKVFTLRMVFFMEGSSYGRITVILYLTKTISSLIHFRLHVKETNPFISALSVIKGY